MVAKALIARLWKTQAAGRQGYAEAVQEIAKNPKRGADDLAALVDQMRLTPGQVEHDLSTAQAVAQYEALAAAADARSRERWDKLTAAHRHVKDLERQLDQARVKHRELYALHDAATREAAESRQEVARLKRQAPRVFAPDQQEQAAPGMNAELVDGLDAMIPARGLR